MGDNIIATAAHLYEHGAYEELKKLASYAWPDDFATVPVPGVSEACRYLFILSG
jgi:hypothetical protein